MTAVYQCLADFDPALPEKVIAVIGHSYRPAFVGQLVSSQLDVDRFDYLLRDSLMTGAKYGNYDLEWIIHALAIDEQNDRVYVASNGFYAVEEYSQARYYMFRQVYFHRALRSAEAVLMSILRRAVELMEASALNFVVSGSVMERVLSGVNPTVAEYLTFDDHDVMFHIKQWTREPDAVLRDLSRRFIERRHFKAIDLDHDEDERARLVARMRGKIEKLGFDPQYYLIEDRAADIPYYSYYRPEGKTRIYIELNGMICDIAKVSSVVRGMRGYELHRLCFPAEAISAFEEVR